jgi:integrase/recombinase XerD
MPEEPPSFTEAADAYLADCARRGLRPATLRAYAYALGRFASAMQLATIREFDLGSVRRFQDAAPTLAGGSMRHILGGLRSFSRWCAEEGFIERDRLARLRLPRVDQRVRTVPTDAELRALLLAAGARLRIALVVLVGTGVRVSDLSSLALADLRDGALVLRTSKNRVGRVVPLDPVLRGLLGLYVADLRPAGEGPLFVSRTESALSPNAIRQALAAAANRARLDVPISPHVLRHWYARDLAAHGSDPRLLGARMGWASAGLLGRYAPVTESELVADVSRYAPLVRLRDEGILRGIFPAAVLTGAQRSKSVPGRGAGFGSRPRRARHS